jgi:hypothetical protein
MNRIFQTLAVLIAIMLPLVLVLGCGEDDEAGPAAELERTDPAAGDDLPANGTLKIYLTNPVKADTKVTVEGNDATGSGKNWSWAATGLTEGKKTLTIEWTNDDDSSGSATVELNITVADTTAPTLTKSTPADGDKDIDYDKINEDAVMTLEFDEAIADAKDLTVMADETVLSWTPKTDDNIVTLEKLKGGELSAETEYTIEGVVKDKAGNETEVTITFTTKAKEE